MDSLPPACLARCAANALCFQNLARLEPAQTCPCPILRAAFCAKGGNPQRPARLASGYTRTMAEIHRRKTPTVKIGHVRVGWEVPVLVQSMTNTDTADVSGTIEQVAALALAGSEIVRVTVNNEEAAAAIPAIVEGLDRCV